MMQIEREGERERGREMERAGGGKRVREGEKRERERDLMFKILVALSPALAMCEHPLQYTVGRQEGALSLVIGLFGN